MSGKGGLAVAIPRFMLKRYGREVVVFDSVGGEGLSVFCKDGTALPERESKGLAAWVKGYRLFGGRL